MLLVGTRISADQKSKQQGEPLSWPAVHAFLCVLCVLCVNASIAAGQAAAAVHAEPGKTKGTALCDPLVSYPDPALLPVYCVSAPKAAGQAAAVCFSPASAFRASTLSRFSQVNSGSSRPKCP